MHQTLNYVLHCWRVLILKLLFQWKRLVRSWRDCLLVLLLVSSISFLSIYFVLLSLNLVIRFLLKLYVLVYVSEFEIHLSDKSSCFVYGPKWSSQATGTVAGCLANKVCFLFSFLFFFFLFTFFKISLAYEGILLFSCFLFCYISFFFYTTCVHFLLQ